MNEYWITFSMGLFFGYFIHLIISAAEFLKEWRKIRDEWKRIRLTKLEKFLVQISFDGKFWNIGSLGQEEAKGPLHNVSDSPQEGR